jgi:hypothetical protein
MSVYGSQGSQGKHPLKSKFVLVTTSKCFSLLNSFSKQQKKQFLHPFFGKKRIFVPKESRKLT